MAAVRQADPERTVVLGSNGFSVYSALGDLAIPPDPHCILTFHYYLPMAVTHCRVPWWPEGMHGEPGAYPPPLAGGEAMPPGSQRPGGGHRGRESMRRHFAVAAAAAARAGLPLNCGEFGCCAHVPIETRRAWLRDALEVLGELGISWTLFDCRGEHFGLFAPGGQDTGIADLVMRAARSRSPASAAMPRHTRRERGIVCRKKVHTAPGGPCMLRSTMARAISVPSEQPDTGAGAMPVSMRHDLALPIITGLIIAATGSVAWCQPQPAAAAWPADVPGFVQPKAGEHPRLLFRKADVPELKRRAATPEGQAMVARLKRLLGGGEAMPANFNRARAAYTSDASGQPLGTYTIGHAAGFAMLWTLTGEKKYADLAKQCAEIGMNGQRDRDDRYAYVNPGGFLRAGPSIVPLAMAYDMAYDGWDAEFREKVRRFLHDYDGGHTSRDGGGQMTLEKMALSPQMSPQSNHFLCQVGGAGMAILAVRGDPGSDAAKMERFRKGVEANAVRGLTEGFGHYGYFHEHLGPSQIPSDNGFMIFMQAARHAAGRDFLSPVTNGRALALRWIHLLVSQDGRPKYHCRYGENEGAGGYGSIWYTRGDEGTHQNSHCGAFAQGFGIVRPEERAALLWTYRHVVEPNEAKLHPRFLSAGEKSYDGLIYPHYLVMALINWPIGQQPRNPAEVLGGPIRDAIHRFYVMRSRWTEDGTTDVVTSVLGGARGQDRFGDARSPVIVWGHGKRFMFNAMPSTPKRGGGPATETFWQGYADGSASLTLNTTALAVDYSKAGGADAVLVMVNPLPVENRQPGAGLGDVTEGVKVEAGGTTWHVLVLGGDARPAADGDALKVGGQTFHFDGKKISMARTAKPLVQ